MTAADPDQQRARRLESTGLRHQPHACSSGAMARVASVLFKTRVEPAGCKGVGSCAKQVAWHTWNVQGCEPGTGTGLCAAAPWGHGHCAPQEQGQAALAGDRLTAHPARASSDDRAAGWEVTPQRCGLSVPARPEQGLGPVTNTGIDPRRVTELHEGHGHSWWLLKQGCQKLGVTQSGLFSI